MSWKLTDELSVTFQLSVGGPGEFGPKLHGILKENPSLDIGVFF